MRTQRIHLWKRHRYGCYVRGGLGNNMQVNMQLAAARERVVRALENYKAVLSESALESLKRAMSDWHGEVERIADRAGESAQ